VIGEIDEAGAEERPDERRHREQEDQPLLIEFAPGVTGKHHEARPAPREWSVVSPISPLVNSHLFLIRGLRPRTPYTLTRGDPTIPAAFAWLARGAHSLTFGRRRAPRPQACAPGVPSLSGRSPP